MSYPQSVELIDVKDYLDSEPASAVRHEYVDGHVFAMAGAGEKHNRIAVNFVFHLRRVARGKPCGVFMSDMKVRVWAFNAFYYPDVMIVCDPEDRHEYYKTAPCLIVEVLSSATEIIDRREKLIGYRTLPGLRHYLLVSQEKRRVEMYSRTASEDVRRYCVIENDGIVKVDCGVLQFTLSIDDIYEDVL